MEFVSCKVIPARLFSVFKRELNKNNKNICTLELLRCVNPFQSIFGKNVQKLEIFELKVRVKSPNIRAYHLGNSQNCNFTPILSIVFSLH